MSILDELGIYDEKKNGEYQNFNENDEKKESSDSENIVLFLNPLYGFIEEDRSVESFHLLDQTVTQLLTC